MCLPVSSSHFNEANRSDICCMPNLLSCKSPCTSIHAVELDEALKIVHNNIHAIAASAVLNTSSNDVIYQCQIQHFIYSTGESLHGSGPVSIPL